MLEAKKLEKIIPRDKDIEKVKIQLAQFETGFPYAHLLKPCKLDDGIMRLDLNMKKHYTYIYKEESLKYSITKFVPASGAASRMFKSLYNYLNNGVRDKACETFFSNLELFPFYGELINKVGISTNKESELSLLEFLLSNHGLDYGNKPKGLIPFHKDNHKGITLPIQDHVDEACKMIKGSAVRLHFTISESHQKEFLNVTKKIIENYKDIYDKDIRIDYSFQSQDTDTIAVDMVNDPFIQDSGEVLFRPGGHGALIQNLNNLDSDLVYIKNIDNVVASSKQSITIQYKKILGGILLDVRSELKNFYLELEKGNLKELDRCADFLKEKFKINFPELPSARELLNLMYRPIRVCGMVKNEGEPGGGPFWLSNCISPQIVEKAQVDLKDEEQLSILNNATHFNPVDLCCYINDYNGEKYDLNNYIDTKTGFISYKSLNGKKLKALELPGLWNGAMANWLTIFVEVPLSTFNPVKTVNDLLKTQHQA